MVEDQASASKQVYDPEPHLPRQVSRLAEWQKHQRGMSVANFMGDLEDMLADGEFYGLSEGDLRILGHLHRAAIRPASNPEGAIVSLSGRLWGKFVGIRRTYLAAKRIPDNLITHLRAIRARS